MERRINPAEAGMAVTARSTGAFKIIEDNRGMETKAIPLEDSEPLGSDAEYLKEIEREKVEEAERKRLEDAELYALEHPNAPKIKSVMKNRAFTKTFAKDNDEEKAKKELEATEEKIRIAQEALNSNISTEKIDEVTVESVEPEVKDMKKITSAIEAQYEKDMAELNERIAKLKKIEDDNKKAKPIPTATPVAKENIATVRTKTPTIVPSNTGLSYEIVKLKEANKSLTDAVVAYQDKYTISELKANYKIQLLIKEIIAFTDEETSGKILSRFYNYINKNESTDNMLSIK